MGIEFFNPPLFQMANWFKLYETDLDETRMRFALTKLPEVWPVWTGILMECCKHRGDTIRWGTKEHELFGFSDRLKVSLPKVNEAIKILCDIDYIKMQDGVIKVLKWCEKQDDYLARKAQGHYKKPILSDNIREYPILSDNIRNYPLEERRGEEIRREELSTKEGVGLLVFLKDRICQLYRRRPEDPMTYAEETALVAVSKRPDARGELSELEMFKSRTQYFPRSVERLLEDWPKVVDRSRNEPERPQDGQSITERMIRKL